MEINLYDILDSAIEFGSLKPDGPDGNPDFYDDAIVGITDDGRLVYSKEMMVQLLYEFDETEYTEAIDFLGYNCWSAYVGELTPIYVNQYW